MSVGGKVIEVILVAPRKIWVNTVDTYDECAIYCDPGSYDIAPGDSLWWDSSWCYFTPAKNKRLPDAQSKCGVTYDIKLKRIGYSGVSRPPGHLKEELERML